MQIVFPLLFKSSNELTAWHYIELIDHAYHAYHALAVMIKKNSLLHMPFPKFSLREHSPRLPSLTCLVHAVEHHMKAYERDNYLRLKHHVRSIKRSVHDYDSS